MNYLRVVLVCCALLLAHDLQAQSGARELSKFRLLLKTGERIEGKDGVLTDSSLVGNSRTGAQLNIPRGDIRALDAYAGSHAAKGAAVGAGMGLLTALLAILQVSADENVSLNEGAAVGVTAGLTIGGGLIGLLVGSTQARWESIPMRTTAMIRPRAEGATWIVQWSF